MGRAVRTVPIDRHMSSVADLVKLTQHQMTMMTTLVVKVIVVRAPGEWSNPL